MTKLLFLSLLMSVGFMKDESVFDLSNDCITSYDVTTLPKGIKKTISKTYKVKFIMANLEDEFQETDVIDKKARKERRLVFWSQCENEFFVVYEHGGFAYHKHFVQLKFSNGKYELISNGNPGNAKNIEDLKSAIQQNKSNHTHF